MSEAVEVRVPDIGDAAEVEVIEILVSPGDTVTAEQGLVSLESDKATMDVPCPSDGVVSAILVAVGDKVSEGSAIASIEPAGSAVAPEPAAPPAAVAEATDSPPEPAAPVPAPGVSAGDTDMHGEVVVLGSGPGGYTAAFRAADLGKKVILIERYPDLGGVCLNVGCIPSKALLHAAKVITETREMAAHGITFSEPSIDLDKLRDWKESVIKQLTGGLAGLAKRRKVETVHGEARFESPHVLTVDGPNGVTRIGFDNCIVAAGSQPVELPFIPHDDPRVIDSTGALELTDIPETMLILGGGIIGLEMATVYHELGTRVSVVELMDSLMAGADPDIVKPFTGRVSAMYENIWLNTKCTGVEATADGLNVSLEGEGAPTSATFDKVLVAVGRRSNGPVIGADQAGVIVDDRGFIPVDNQQRTNVPHIFAIGDIVGQPMLAHKAVHEGKVAAEVCAGEKSTFVASVIPSVAYTDPEVAWVGVTETEAKEKGIEYEKGAFPWAASGRSLSLGRNEGLTKLLFDPKTERVIGAGIVGPNAGDLINEVALAIEMGSDAEDIALTIHAHPTLSETVAFAAEAFEGTLTDLYIPKRKKKA